LKDENTIRLNRFLSQTGLCSRRAAEELIRKGRVSVNGLECRDLSVRIDPEHDRVRVDGQELAPSGRLIYVALNKPKGYVTTLRDERGRKCVKELVEGVGERVFPVGRLDRNSEGLLLFTNDGLTAHRLMHPSFGLEKVYRVTVDRSLSKAELLKIRSGVELEDGPAHVLKAESVADDMRKVELTIQEGRKREIRRIFQALGFRVIALKRIRFGPISLGRLPSGKWRKLSTKETRDVLRTVGRT
jgi:pseudouridine synthase